MGNMVEINEWNEKYESRIFQLMHKILLLQLTAMELRKYWDHMLYLKGYLYGRLK